MSARQLYTLMACGHWSSWNAPDREPQVGVLYWCDQHGDTDELVVCAHVAQAHHYVEETAPKLERQPAGWATGKRFNTPYGPGYRVTATDHAGEYIADPDLLVVQHGDRWSAYAGSELVVDGRPTRAQAANRLAWELADRIRRAVCDHGPPPRVCDNCSPAGNAAPGPHPLCTVQGGDHHVWCWSGLRPCASS